MNKYEVTAEISFTKVYEVYADDRDAAEDQVLEELEGTNKGSIFLDDDWKEEGKDVVTVVTISRG